MYCPSIRDCIQADTLIGKGNILLDNRFLANNFLSRKVSLGACGQIVKDGKVTLLGILVETKKVVSSESKFINPKMVRIKNAKNRQKWISFLIRLNIFAKEQLYEEIDIFKAKRIYL